MTGACMEWIAWQAEVLGAAGNVLEVGSMDVNGSPRGVFSDRARFPSYLGVDMRPGRGVDAVMNCQQLAFLGEAFDVIVDAERLEHDEDFRGSYRELSRVARPECLLIATTRSWGGFPVHDYPSDYWRFTEEGLRSVLVRAGFECLVTKYGEVGEDNKPRAVFAVGRRLAL